MTYNVFGGTLNIAQLNLIMTRIFNFSDFQHYLCRRVLELGSGSGFLGSVICSICSPSSFTFSDCHDEVIELLVENICRNLHLTGEFGSHCCSSRCGYQHHYCHFFFISLLSFILGRGWQVKD